MIKKCYKTKILPLNKLKYGMVLAEAIHTKTQKMMIIPAGRVVNEEIMQIINNKSQGVWRSRTHTLLTIGKVREWHNKYSYSSSFSFPRLLETQEV